MSVGFVAGAIITAGVAAHSAEEAGDAAHQQNLRAQEAGDREMKLLEAQIRQADELLAFNKETYQEGKARQERIDALNEKVVNQNLNLSEKAGVRADEAYDFYKNVGRPVVQRSIEEANNFDSAANIEAARGRAAADVQQAADGAASQTQRTLARLGVNPSSGRFLEMQNRLQAERQAATAGALTNAEQGVRDQAIGLRAQASNLAQGFPAQSMGQAGQSSGFGVAGAGVAAGSGAAHLNLARTAMAGMETGAGLYGDGARGFGRLGSQATNLASGYSDMSSQLYGVAGRSFGNAVARMPSWNSGRYIGSGMGAGETGVTGTMGDPWGNGGNYADGGKIAGPEGGGGKVVGPGTGTSDSVRAVNADNGQPIRVSNGEYVIPEDVVKKMGTAYFDKLLQKHHKPVNMRSVA